MAGSLLGDGPRQRLAYCGMTEEVRKQAVALVRALSAVYGQAISVREDQELLVASAGYRDFVARLVAEDAETWDLPSFVEWLVAPGTEDDYRDWTAEQFREELERWYS